MKLAFALFVALSVYAQTVSFSPQQTTGKHKELTLWLVDASSPGKAAIPAATLYSIAATHGVGHVDATLASTILATKASRSVLAIGVQVLQGLGASTAVGTVIKNGGIVTTGTAAEIQNISLVVAGVATFIQPLVSKNQTPSPNPAVAAEILGPELKLGADGSGSALFYSLASNVGPFVEKLP